LIYARTIARTANPMRPSSRVSNTEASIYLAICAAPSRHLRVGFYNSSMARYTFRIRQGSYSSDVPVDLPNDDAAWDEAAMVCSDMIRDTVARPRDSPEWRLEDAEKGDQR
jgi:hypothetical protein